MQPLVDADVLLHEIGWSSEFVDEDLNEHVILDVERAVKLMDDKIALICNEVGATQPPLIFLTNTPFIRDLCKRMSKYWGPEKDYYPNFRHEIAVSKPYKGNRTNPKPFHFYNLTAHLLNNPDCVVSWRGLEADDCIVQYQQSVDFGVESIICSRDKDLRMCPGWHYSWGCGRQASIGPVFTEPLGHLEKKPDGKILGYGLSFFYYQLLVGDGVDNVPGLPGCGPVKAMKILEGADTELELFTRVKKAYEEAGMTKEYLLEQGRLLWMTPCYTDKPILWEFPFEEESN